jgi:hypothetical protein
MTIRSQLDLTQKLSREDYEQQLSDRSRRMDQLRLALGGKLGDGKIGPGLLVCIERTSGMTREGVALKLDIRSTTVFRKEKGHWRVVHHHTDRF